MGQEKAYSYSLFKQLKDETHNSVSKLPTSNFIGAELRYHFDTNSKVALVGGKYSSLSKQEEVPLSGFNSIIELGENELSSKLLYKDAQWKERNWQELSWYIQYVHELKEKNYLIARIRERKHFDSWQRDEVLLGYNYKLKPTLSLKSEVRQIKQTGVNSFKSNELFLSLSVLF